MMHIVKKLSPDQRRYALLGSVLLLVIGSIYFLNDAETGIATRAEITPEIITATIEEKAEKYPRAREIIKPHGFINTPDGTTIEEFIGDKVVLVDFWTYSCINCQRTQPFLNAWHEKYADQGLLILGIHTPEFEFEKELTNVEDAVAEAEIKYPVILDNDYGTWSAYQNRYWPRKYLIDIDGFVVYDHIGEGAYESTEKKIQELLAERAARLGEDMSIERGTVDVEAEKVNRLIPRTHEIYFGARRNASLIGNGVGGAEGEQDFVLPAKLTQGKFHLEGTWNITREFAENREVGARIVLPYQAQKVFIVASSQDGARVRVLVDGKPLDERVGSAVEENGTVFVQDEKLYRLIEAPRHESETLELIIEEGTIEIFTFTFG